jgi:cytochrome c biogenesis protein
VNPVLRVLTSVKVAIALIAWLVLGGIAATVLPGLGTAFFRSPFFIAPAIAFFVNLAACSVRRLVRELRRPGRHRHGPDILHLGLLVLMAGAVISYQGKRTGTVSLAPGESATLPDGSTLTVTDFRFDRYPDGRPKEWATTVRVQRDGRTLLDGFVLRVNRPLRRSGFSYYQSTYGEAWQLGLRVGSGPDVTLHEGEQAALDGTTVAFMTAEDVDGAVRAVVRVGEGADATVVRAAPGDTLGGAVVTEVRDVLTTGIQAVADPGWPVVAAAFALVAIGTALTFIQKLREAA